MIFKSLLFVAVSVVLAEAREDKFAQCFKRDKIEKLKNDLTKIRNDDVTKNLWNLHQVEYNIKDRPKKINQLSNELKMKVREQSDLIKNLALTVGPNPAVSKCEAEKKAEAETLDKGLAPKVDNCSKDIPNPAMRINELREELGNISDSIASLQFHLEKCKLTWFCLGCKIHLHSKFEELKQKNNLVSMKIATFTKETDISEVEICMNEAFNMIKEKVSELTSQYKKCSEK